MKFFIKLIHKKIILTVPLFLEQITWLHLLSLHLLISLFAHIFIKSSVWESSLVVVFAVEEVVSTFEVEETLFSITTFSDLT